LAITTNCSGASKKNHGIKCDGWDKTMKDYTKLNVDALFNVESFSDKSFDP
jgi:hypothetical protein